jgi:fucose permease
MVLALLGSIKLPLAKRLTLDETRVGGLVSALFLAIIPMMLLSGLLVDRLGVKWVLVSGSALTAVALSLLALSQSYSGALGAILLAGAGWSCVSSSCTVLMPAAFYPSDPAASLNLGNAFFGLGALVTPLLADLLVRRIGFKWTLGVLAMFCLLPAVAGTVPEFPKGPPGGDLSAVVQSPILWLAALGLFLYVPLEGVVSTWATTYLTELGVRERRAAVLLSGFWCLFLAARLLASFLHVPPSADPWVVVGLALLAAVVLGNMTGSPGKGGATWGLLLLGAFFGPIFPTLVAIVLKRFSENQGTAYGTMFALGATGSLILPPVIGAYARRRTVQKALGLATVVALLLAAAALVLGLWLRVR